MTRSQIAKLREQYINEREAILKTRLSSVERKLYERLFNVIVDNLEKDGKKISSSNKNIDLTSEVDKVFKQIHETEYNRVIRQFSSDLAGLQDLNKTYFSIIENDQKKVASISKQVSSAMNKRLGLNKTGEVVKDGFIDRLAKDKSLANKIKQETYKAITKGQSIEAYRNNIKTLIVGNDKINGGLTQHFNQFAFDVYAQADATTQKLWADKLGLNAFVYAGTIIKTSRKFCKDHNNNVYTVEEAAKWTAMVGKENGPIFDDTYSPLIDRGGFNCRHGINYITDSEAIRQRPDLKEILK